MRPSPKPDSHDHDTAGREECGEEQCGESESFHEAPSREGRIKERHRLQKSIVLGMSATLKRFLQHNRVIG